MSTTEDEGGIVAARDADDLASGQVAAPAEATTLPPELATLFETALAQERRGELDAARRTLSALLQHVPDHAGALHLAGIVLFRQGHQAEALRFLRRAVAQGLATPLVWRNLCEVARTAGHLDEALAAGQQAVRLAPDNPASLHNLAIVHAQRLEYDAAIACDRRALAQDPNHAGAHFGLAETLLKQGEFAEGLEHYRWRFRLPGAGVNLPRTDRPVWDGRPLAPSRLLLVADQGFGDVIQFSRYIPWAAERAPTPLVACDRQLAPILAAQAGGRLFHRWEDLPEFDAYLPISGLPFVAGTRLETIPAPIPYLHPEPALAATWRARLERLLPRGARRVGLVWAGRPTHPNDSRRSATLAELAPLLDMEDTAFVALQKGAGQDAVGGYFGRAPLLHLGPELGGWADTMAVLASLDAVVAVDTAVAHLAGAMGRPVHLMLAHAGEWRWLHERRDSPWYPTMRLHRQASPGDWSGVASSVRQALTTPTETFLS